ncbi:MAG: hypothetical protein M3340_05385 [Actinomycetota bacterium]|nr:hypothetical protein [Actinomycetota bacterium]
MTVIARPNAWVAVEDDPATQLTYAPRVDPAPLTVSVPGRDPTLGALVVVITNGTPADIALTSVTFTIVVGKPGVEGSPLMPTTQGVKTLVSDTTRWSFTGPSSPVTSGTADYVLAPRAGGVTLAAGASIYVEIYDFQTVTVPGTSTIDVAEVVGGGDPEFTSFAVSTFPDGFFFDSLTVNVRQGSALVPVAQVPSGAGITLTWNSSLANTASQTVYWSSATAGQQKATPSKLGEWSTPQGAPLTSDTVFVVVVTAQTTGGEPLTASLATAVSVQNPALVAASVQTGTLTASGPVTANGGLTASQATVNGPLTASGATVNGALTASGAIAANGGLTASAATVNGALTASGAVAANGGLTASQATVSGALTANGGATVSNGLTATGNVTLGYAWITRLFMNTDLMNSIYAINNSNSYPTGYFQNNSGRAGNQVTGVYARVAQGSDWGLYTNGRSGSDNLAVTHVETRNGHRVVASPLALEAQVQVSGRARLSGGSARIELEPEAADMIAHGDEHEYRVLVTPGGPCNGIAVTARDAEGFEVTELLDGTSDAEFDWLLIAHKRRELGSSEPDTLPESLPEVQEPPPIEGGPS